MNNNKELEIVIEEWEQVGKGTKTVPLVQIGTNEQQVSRERKIFAFIAKKLKSLVKPE